MSRMIRNLACGAGALAVTYLLFAATVLPPLNFNFWEERTDRK